MHLTIRQKGMILVGLPLVIQLILLTAMGGLLRDAEREAWRESHSRIVMAKANEISKVLLEAGYALVKYAGDHKESSLEEYDKLVKQLLVHFVSLEWLAEGSAYESEQVLKIEDAGSHIIAGLENGRRMIDMHEKAYLLQDLRPMREELKSRLAVVLAEIGTLSEHERKMQAQGQSKGKRAKELLVQCIYAGAAAGVLATFGLTVFFSKGINSRLLVLVENARRIASQSRLCPPLEGKDELSYVDSSFHEMAVALAEAMRKERAVVEQAADVIFTLDRSLRITRINPATLVLWGYAEEELIAHELREFIGEDASEKTFDQIAKTVGSDLAASFETTFRARNGAAIAMLLSLSWSHQDDSLFCIAHDITERKLLERQKQDFINMISHDVRTPVTSMQFILELVTSGACGDLPRKALEQLEAAKRNSIRLHTLVSNLLDIEKMEAGELKLAIDTVSLQVLIERVLDSVSGLAEKAGVDLVARDLPEVDILADGGRLEQVLVNLISNGIRYSPKGGRVEVSVQPLDDIFEFRVSDNGHGVPAQDREMIFERFKQSVPSASNLQPSSGLGLAICKAIVQAHGGKIGMRDREGGGSVFWFTIPSRATPD